MFRIFSSLSPVGKVFAGFAHRRTARREVSALQDRERELKSEIALAAASHLYESEILAPYIELFARIDSALDGLMAPSTQHLDAANHPHQEFPSGRKALDAVLGKTSSRRTPVEEAPVSEEPTHPDIWIDHTVRDKGGVAAGSHFFEFPGVPVVLEVRVCRDYDVRPGKPTKFNVWRHARFVSWDDLCEFASFRQQAYKKLLGWKSFVSLECDSRHAEAQAMFEAKRWMMSALRREIELGGDNLSTKEYEEALSLRNSYQAQIAQATAELSQIRARMTQLQMA